MNTPDPIKNGYMLILDVPPSSNRYWRSYGHMKHPVRSPEALAYIEMVGWKCLEAGIIEPLAGDLAFHITWYRKAKQGDLSNRLKVIEDSLQGYAYEDDKQIVEIHAYRKEDKKNPRIEIEIAQIGVLTNK